MSRNQVPTPHIGAQYDEVAKKVIMSGDPLRAKLMADNYLENPVLYNEVRGMFGYTGSYKGVPISVQGHGMGIPSIGIYSYELFNFYDVDCIIRVGTCGTHNPSVKPGTIIIADEAVTDSNYGYQYELPEGYRAFADKELLAKSVAAAGELGIEVNVGTILSADVFYDVRGLQQKFFDEGALGVEMEAYALYTNAFVAGKKSLTIVTISDNIATGEKMTTDQRQKGLSNAITIAMEALVR